MTAKKHKSHAKTQLILPEQHRHDLSAGNTTSPYPQKLALISPTSGCRSVDIFRLRTESHATAHFSGYCSALKMRRHVPPKRLLSPGCLCNETSSCRFRIHCSISVVREQILFYICPAFIVFPVSIFLLQGTRQK
jgi:hypothetical protein